MPKDLIEAGFLVKPSYCGLEFKADLDNVKITAGDYDQGQLSQIRDRPELIAQLVETWFELSYQRSTIVFAVSVQHAENIADGFNNAGVSAAVVTGKTPISTRNELYQLLAHGDLKILSSCSALSEGFDVPQVSSVILARPTKSKALYFQQVGRGLRLAENKQDCIVLDQSGNVLEHGFVEDLTEVELLTSEDSKSHNLGKPPRKICPIDDGGCGNYIHASLLKCPHCDYNFDLKKLITILGRTQLISAEDKIRLNLY